MTPRDIIDRVDRIKPNAFEDEDKLLWLGELEGHIAADVFLLSATELAQLKLTYPDSMAHTMLVVWPHDSIYELWLQAKIDFHNGEYEKYQNTMAAYNEYYTNFVAWFVRNYEPAQGYRGIR